PVFATSPLFHSCPPRRSSDLRHRYRVRSRWIYTGVGLFMALAVLYGFDLVHSIGRVPRGTEVAGIQVGGMRTADAERRLIAELRSEEHTSELQSRFELVCRLL